MADDLDFYNLRAVAKAATPGPWILQCRKGKMYALCKILDSHMAEISSASHDDAKHIATFNPVLVLRLLDLAQRPPASPQSEKWRELALRYKDLGRRYAYYRANVVLELTTALIAAADACDRECKLTDDAVDEMKKQCDEKHKLRALLATIREDARGHRTESIVAAIDAALKVKP